MIFRAYFHWLEIIQILIWAWFCSIKSFTFLALLINEMRDKRNSIVHLRSDLNDQFYVYSRLDSRSYWRRISNGAAYHFSWFKSNDRNWMRPYAGDPTEILHLVNWLGIPDIFAMSWNDHLNLSYDEQLSRRATFIEQVDFSEMCITWLKHGSLRGISASFGYRV